MKIGLYFGSFNPIHTGHLIIANTVLNLTNINQVWFIVSPQNPLKASSSLLNEYHRLYLAQKATEDDERIKVSDIEFKLPKPSFTIDTLTFLEERYKGQEFVIIIGSDSYKNIHKWKNASTLLSRYSFLIYQRPGFEVGQIQQENISILQAPMLEISATEVRNLIKTGKSIRYMVPEKVREEITVNGYYK